MVCIHRYLYDLRCSSTSTSYQVPKEVGKVGTESSTFIEPVSNRKDGIQAMFSKQVQKQSQYGKPQPHNTEPQAPASQDLKPSHTLKRSRSPEAHNHVTPEPPRSSTKKPKLTKSESPDPKITILSTPPKSSSGVRAKVCLPLSTPLPIIPHVYWLPVEITRETAAPVPKGACCLLVYVPTDI